jgi:hypothetical protein
VRNLKFGQRIDNGVDDDAQCVRGTALPAGRVPSGCVVDGTSLISVVKNDSTSARGIA